MARQAAVARSREEERLARELQHVWGLWQEAVNDG
jgi:hypothetical protein